MPSERTKPSSRTSTTTSQGSRGQRRPSEASKNEPVKEPDKPKDRTSKGRPEVDKGKDKRPDPRGRSVSDRQKVDEKKPEVDKGKDKKPEPRGRSVSDRQKPDEKKTNEKTRERGKSESGNQKPEAAGTGNRENGVKTRDALIKEREKERQEKEKEKKEKEREKEKERQKEKDKAKEQRDNKSRSSRSKLDERSSSKRENGKSLAEPLIIPSDPVNEFRAPPPPMSPGPSRRRWDKDKIVTDLAHEDSEDDEIINPKPDKIEIVRKPSYSNPDIDEAPIKSGFVDGDQDEEENYEDDFEDYEEDFESDEDEDDEEEESNEEDSNASSSDDKSEEGPFATPLSDAQKRRQEKEMAEVKQAMIRENSVKYTRRNDNSQQQSNNNESNVNNNKTSTTPSTTTYVEQKRGFINFSAAKERQKTKFAAGRARRRGDELLSMIRLDIVTFALFELPPIRYEDFMRTFGTSNMTQNSMQTGEDNLDEDIQTDKIVMLDKWTQRPPVSSIQSAVENYDLFMQNVRGCGGQMSSEAVLHSASKSWEFSKRTDSHRLAKFLTSAGNVLSTLLEEESSEVDRGDKEDKEVVFSAKVTYLTFGDYPGLSGSPIEGLVFAPDQEGILLTVHGPEEFSENDLPEVRSYLCVWNVRMPHRPIKILVSEQRVTASCFSPTKASLVLSGMEDGSVCMWDLREGVFPHREVAREAGLDEFVIRSPTYVTNDESHTSRVTAIKPLPVSGEGLSSLEDMAPTAGSLPIFQIVTIEEEGGRLIIWTVLDSQHDMENHLGLAHWGSIRLVCSTIVDLNTIAPGLGSVVAHDVTFDPNDGSHLFIATETGLVLHGSSQPDHRPSPRCYRPELDSTTACHSLAFCPFGESFFLAGSDDGSVRLHSVANERPLITWPGTVNGEPVLKLIWSTSRPCVFIVLDTANRIHLWDLGAGDIYPVHGVEFDDKVHSIALSPELSGSKESQLLAIGMVGGKIEVHTLKPEYKSKGPKECRNELEKFLHYVSII